MAEHFRDFNDPKIDTYAEPSRDPERDLKFKALAKATPYFLQALGGELVGKGEDGQDWRFWTVNGQAATITLRDPDVFGNAAIRYGDVGLFYTYATDGQPVWVPNTDLTYRPTDLDSTGDPENDALVTVTEALWAASNPIRHLGQRAAQIAAPFRDRHALRDWQTNPERTSAEIAAHYDLSQEVYTGPLGILDESYVQYSSGYLAPGKQFESLDDLQEQKVTEIAKKLQLDTAERLLEVGGGWGGLAVALAQRYPNLHITSLTVSAEQYKRAVQRANKAGVADRVKFLQEDYRNHYPEQPYDRLVSIEMLEAVDWRDHNVYFDALARLATPNAIAVLQTINIKPNQWASQKHNKSFANTAIFPGGFLTPRKAIVEHMARRGWIAETDYTELGPSYELTLREWRRRFTAARPELEVNWTRTQTQAEIARFTLGFGFYLSASQAGFSPRTNRHLTDSLIAFQLNQAA